MKRWHGLKSLVADAVEHGSRAVERVHLEIARKPFAVLEAIPAISAPAKVVHLVHDATVSTTHVAIRTVSVAVFATVGFALDAAEVRAGVVAPPEPGVGAAGARPEPEDATPRSAE